MPVLLHNNFGGIAPRVPKRALAETLAQVNHNLMPSATEFRPVGGDRVDETDVVQDAKTLYRMARNGAGQVAGVPRPWRTHADVRSYVAGQLNDDATERTVVTFDDGSQAPRAVTADGADRLLGVPIPPAPQAAVNAVAQFTREDADAWLEEGLVPAIWEAAAQALYDDVNDPQAQKRCRADNHQPVAGAFGSHGLTQHASQPWIAYYPLPVDTAHPRMLELEGQRVGEHHRVHIVCLPFWGLLPAPAGSGKPSLMTTLQAIEHPSTGQPLLTQTQAQTVNDRLVKFLDPNGDVIAADRKALDAKVQELVQILSGTANGAPTPPDKPQEPTVPRYRERINAGDFYREEHPDWTAYRNSLRAWEEAMADHDKTLSDYNALWAQKAAQAKALQAECRRLADTITDKWHKRKRDGANMLRDMARNNMLAGEDGGWVSVDPDRIIDTRFYIVTFVTDWGEESAPSPVSAMLEVDQNDTVTLQRPAIPPGRHITRWRVYRSNVGGSSAYFQFVEDVPIALTEYTDTVPGERLGEVCPTMTWQPPPYRMDTQHSATIKPPKGTDPYLRGLVGMPNGILAGFIDNYVAFCEPYHPYAWPVEYQITTQHPIVGLGVFGQTLFVGTLGNPYLISGADSASMSAIKLDDEQACISARSIVSVGGGVVYASPDGLCFASGSGVEVITSAYWAREDWAALNPRELFAVAHEGAYFFWLAGQCYVLDVPTRKLVTLDLPATAAYRDTVTDMLYVVQGEQVLEVFGGDERRMGRWVSRLHVTPAQRPFAWMRVLGEQTPAQPVTVRWSADGQQRYEKVLTDSQPVRLPPGRWLEHEIEVTSTARVLEVALYGTTQELQGV